MHEIEEKRKGANDLPNLHNFKPTPGGAGRRSPARAPTATAARKERVDELNAMGLQEVLAVRQAQYDRYFGK